MHSISGKMERPVLGFGFQGTSLLRWCRPTVFTKALDWDRSSLNERTGPRRFHHLVAFARQTYDFVFRMPSAQGPDALVALRSTSGTLPPDFQRRHKDDWANDCNSGIATTGLE